MKLIPSFNHPLAQSLYSLGQIPTERSGTSPRQRTRLRVEEAKRRLERTLAPVDEISWKVGYEDPAFFRTIEPGPQPESLRSADDNAISH